MGSPAGLKVAAPPVPLRESGLNVRQQLLVQGMTDAHKLCAELVAQLRAGEVDPAWLRTRVAAINVMLDASAAAHRASGAPESAVEAYRTWAHEVVAREVAEATSSQETR